MALHLMMVALGCALGGVARFLLGKGVNAQPWADGFPWATLIINVSGSICLGIVAEFYLERESSSFRMETYLLLGTGFCGGFTTFSSFSLEMLNLIKAGAILPSIAYAISSVLLSLLGVFIGMHGMKALYPPN
ncbi:MAG: fluoride efflux transporter CrcB [Planctomycetota bacterium]|nr:fluoride efflux transporter CrcB [Planctomycetota bacterium]